MSERIDADRAGTVAPPRPEPALPVRRVRAEGPLEVTGSGASLRAAGSVDLDSHGEWARLLDTAARSGADVHLDLAGLGFIDSRGVTALVEAAHRMPVGRRIVVHRAPPSLRRIMEVLWPDGAEVVDIDGDGP